jgi:Tfp pilus assembly protein PilO
MMKRAEETHEDTSMSKWTFKTEINIGNLITLAVMLAGFIYGYSQLNEQVKMVAEGAKELRATDRDHSLQLQSLRESAASQREAVSTKLARIETLVEQVVKQVDRIQPAQTGTTSGRTAP